MNNKIIAIIVFLLSVPFAASLQFSNTMPVGFNLVSIPIQLENNTLPKAFESFMANVSSIFVYRNNVWLSYSPTAPSFLNTLNELYVQDGMWLNMKRNSPVTVYGNYATYPVSFSINPNWNLIGYPSFNSSNVSSAFGGVMSNIYSVFAFQNNGSQWLSYSPARPAFLNTLNTIYPGMGIWVNAKASASWTFSGTAFSNVSCIPSLEVCDGIDNDCNPVTPDGSSDPLVGLTCDGSDTDLCKEGTSSCSAGAIVCSDNTGSTLDICNGIDDDCDASSADGSEDPQNGQACDGPDSDLCLEGTKSCSAGALVCSDNTGSTLDICNGLDDDCDPASADGSEDPQNGQACDGPDSDLCLEGTKFCSAGSMQCSDNTGSTLDICNGLDDDCDPSSADGSEDPLVGIACDGPDSDLCKEGTNSCSAGAIVCSDNTASTVDICNGLDDDCDPSSADGSEDPQNGQACDGPDSDLCLEGTKSCSAGALVCSDNTGSTVDLCNGLDDDCDAASADGSEDPQNGQACDGPDSDLCLEGTKSCSAGALVCSDNTGSTVDLCNGLNDDCDAASADGSEDPLVGIACDGVDSDLCKEGTSSCSAGAIVCSDNTGNNVEVCNGLDDDCDNTTDEGGDALCADALFCNGAEVCAGTLGCQSGTAIDCSPYSIPAIAQCDYVPDGNIFTWDYAPAYTSVCNETSDSCMQNYQFTHTCDMATCGAVCDGAEHCPLTCNGTKMYNVVSCSLATGCVCQYANPICVKNMCGATCKVDADCNDSNPSTTDTCVDCTCQHQCNPQTEVCDGIDNDCDNLTDSADPSLQLTLCELQLGVCAGKSHTASQCVSGAWNPCDATNYGIYYGLESCDTRDNDCDGSTDENGATNCTSYYRDWDRDGYGLTSDLQCVCPLNKGYYNATLSGDCNDTNPFMFPGFTEVCDSFDNDCDSIADECGNSTPDPFEPNNDKDHAYYFGNAIEYGYGTEWSCWTVSFDMYNDNEDWWYYSINDTQVQIVDPRAKISLSNLTRNNITLPQDMNVDVCIYFDRGKDGSIDYSNCSNKPGSSWENVSISVETGGDDSGYLYYQLKKISGNSCSKLSVCDHW